MEIYYHPLFRRQYRKLAQDLKLMAQEKEAVFRDNPFDPRLDTHKLHGRYSRFWGFSIDNSNRIIFKFAEKGRVEFYQVGNHTIYR